MKIRVMKGPIVATALGASLLAASSYAQTPALGASPAQPVDVSLTESMAPSEVAVVPALAAAFLAGALVAEVVHHHKPLSESNSAPIENGIKESIEKGSIDVIFDP